MLDSELSDNCKCPDARWRSSLHALGPGPPQNAFGGFAGVGIDEHDGVDVVGEVEDRAEKCAGTGAGPEPSSQNQPPFFSQPGSEVSQPSRSLYIMSVVAATQHLVIAQAGQEQAEIGDRGVPAGRPSRRRRSSSRRESRGACCPACRSRTSAAWAWKCVSMSVMPIGFSTCSLT